MKERYWVQQERYWVFVLAPNGWQDPYGTLAYPVNSTVAENFKENLSKYYKLVQVTQAPDSPAEQGAER